MGFFGGLIIGLVVGAGGMFLVYKNNKDKFKAAADEMDTKFADLKAKYEKKE